ncbi:hypothetical protein BGZ76_010076 [Entomortierella beljakovae]|nr:hypothetical protein BGZ76_010076 [Entomortierella beljakovae]
MLSTVSLIDPTTLNPSFSGPENSRMGRPAVIITRGDQQSSIDHFQLLLTNAKAYRLQMLALSKAAANFGYALEKIAHSKAAVRDPTNVSSSLQAASGLHYLMSNHHQILSDTLYKQFEIPLLQHLDTHKANIEATEAQYERSMRDMSQKIKETEATSLQNGHLFQFRQALTTLTMQVDELERIKIAYYFSNLESEQANLQLILQKTSTIVRAEVDIYERIANKGLNDSILEPMTTQGPDPYCTYPTTDEFSSIFSILPPTPIIPTSGGGATGTSTPQHDSIMSNFYGYHESNPFSTARNLNNNPSRDRHLFGDASSIESKESITNTDEHQIIVESATVTSETHPIANASTNEIRVDSDGIINVVNKPEDVASDNNSTSRSQLSKTENVVANLGLKETEPKTPTQEVTKNLDIPQEAQSPVDKNGVEDPAAPTGGMDLRLGEQHHRRQASFKEDHTIPASSPSEPSSSVRSYSLRSRSGSRSHHLLSSTPDSPPVRGTIHIGKDSELLNNRDFSFSYEPTELLEQRNSQRHGAGNTLHTYGVFDEEEVGGFGETPPIPRQQLNHSQLPQIGHGRSGNHHHSHGLRHHSSDGQLSHSSSSVLSSIGSSNSVSSGILHHRRSTGRIKTDFESSATMFDTSLDGPFMSSIKHQVEESELRRGFDDGMPAFFDDEPEVSRSIAPRSSFGFGSSNASRRQSGSDQDMEKPFVNSSNSIGSTNVNEIAA